MSNSVKPVRFAWRLARNVLSMVPPTRSLLFPGSLLAARFGPGDSAYAWSIYRAHKQKLQSAGFTQASKILEVGPGQNLGTALLWWADLSSTTADPVEVWCWDVFPNAAPDRSYWISTAVELLAVDSGFFSSAATEALQRVARGEVEPGIKYLIAPLDELEVAAGASTFDLTYSQAAIEHIWFIDEFWDAVARLSRPSSWQSHRIDLADHGSREKNYLEFLEWSPPTYWLTMRFVPGACNRWRACHHIEKLQRLGFEMLTADHERRPELPVPIANFARRFRQLSSDELRTTGLDLVARRTRNCESGG